MNSLVSYGKLRQSFIGALGVIVRSLLARSSMPASRVKLYNVDELTEFSDSGVWGGESVDPASEMQVFRVSDFKGDFVLNYSSPPYRALTEDQKQKFALKKGDILVVKSSGSAKQVVSGRVAVFEPQGNDKYAASNFLMRLRPKKTLIDPHYMAFVLGSPPIREEIANSVKTMTYPNLSYTLYRTIAIPVLPIADQRQIADFLTACFHQEELPPLPVYLSEQRRIVARIEELAAKIEEARGLRRQATEEAEALWKSGAQKIFASVTLAGVRPLRELVTVRGGGTPSKANPFFCNSPAPL